MVHVVHESFRVSSIIRYKLERHIVESGHFLLIYGIILLANFYIYAYAIVYIHRGRNEIITSLKQFNIITECRTRHV